MGAFRLAKCIRMNVYEEYFLFSFRSNRYLKHTHLFLEEPVFTCLSCHLTAESTGNVFCLWEGKLTGIIQNTMDRKIIGLITVL